MRTRRGGGGVRAGTDPTAGEALPPLVRAEFAHALRRAAVVDPAGADEPWHRLRISTKRARYPAEVCVPVVGIPAEAFAAQLTLVTEELGGQQDAAVAEIVRSRRAFPQLWAAATAPSYRAWFAEEVR